MQKNELVDKDKENKSRPVTEEELAAQQYLFEAAYNDIKGGQSRKEVVQKLAKDLADIGYDKTRIARAIVKKLTHDPLKITSDDYVRRVLGEEYKDYPQKSPVKKDKDKKVKVKVKGKKKDSELDIEKTKQEDGKEITTVYLKQPKKDVEITAATTKKTKVVPSDKIQLDDLSGEAEVELTPSVHKASSPTLEAKVRVLEEENLKLKEEKERAIDTMDRRIKELLAEVEELGRSYQQRCYLTATVGGDRTIIAYFGVAMPKTKSMGVVKKSATPLETVDEKNQDFAEWQKNLAPGRVSVDVIIDDTKPTVTKSKSPESA